MSVFCAYVAAYATHLKALGWSNNSIRAYISRVRRFMEHAEQAGLYLADLPANLPEMESLAREYLEFAEAGLELRSSSVNAHCTAVSHFLRFLGCEEISLARKPSQSSEEMFLNDDELQKFLSVVLTSRSARDRALLTLIACCGLRLQDCAALAIDHVQIISDEQAEINVPGRRQRIQIDGVVLRALRDWLRFRESFGEMSANNRALFLTSQGAPVRATTIAQVVRTYGIRARLVLTTRLLLNTHNRISTSASRVYSQSGSFVKAPVSVPGYERGNY